MQTRLLLVTLAGSFALLVVILELVRRRLLKEKYSLVWMVAAILLVVLSASKPLLVSLSSMMGIAYAPSAFFLLAFVFLMLITLQFSVVISRLSERNKALAQELALLKLKVEKMASEKETV